MPPHAHLFVYVKGTVPSMDGGDDAFLDAKQQEFKWKDEDEHGEEKEEVLTGFEKACGGGVKVSNFMPCCVKLCCRHHLDF